MSLYKEAKKLVEQGFGVIPLTKPVNSKGGKIPSTRSNLFTELDENGNPIPLVDEYGSLILDGNGKQTYAKACGGGSNPITDDNILMKAFADPSYTDRSIDYLNVAIVTGHETGVVVLDIDGEIGHTNLGLLQDKYGVLPKTVRASTGRDAGYHLLFQNPKVDGKYVKLGGSRGSFLAPDIDYKGDHGYIVAPPSEHKSGKLYKWDRPLEDIVIADLPVLPDWVATLLLGKKWHSREDGLFEAESKEYWINRKKPNRPRQPRVKSDGEQVDIPDEFIDGFWIKDPLLDSWVQFNDITEYRNGTFECNCFMHNSTSARSFHIDLKESGEYEWWCFGCDEGGRAYTPAEYEAEELKFTNNAYLNGATGDDYLDIMSDEEVPQKPAKPPIDDFDDFDALDIKPSYEAPVYVKPEPVPVDDDIENATSIIPLPENINDGITLDEFGAILNKYLYKKKYIPPMLDDYIDYCSEGKSIFKGTYLLGMISHYAGLLGNNYEIYPNLYSPWKEPTLIWGAGVGRSGIQKTGVFTKIDAPFKKIYNFMKKHDKGTRKEYNRLVTIYNKGMHLWRNNEDDDNMPSAVSRHKYPIDYSFAEDITLAKLHEQAEYSHRGVNIIEDEIMSFIESFGAFNQGSGYYKKSLLEAYDSKQNKLVGRVSTGEKDIPRWHINLFGLCVRADFKKNLLDENNCNDGWSARFLVTTLPNCKVGNLYEPREQPDLDSLEKTAESMYGVKPIYDEKTNSIIKRKVIFTKEAQAFWIKFDRERSLMMNNCEELNQKFYHSTFQKQIGQAARLSAIIHLIKFHSGRYPGLEELKVDLDSAISGCYLSMYFHKHMYSLLFDADETDDTLLTNEQNKIAYGMYRWQMKNLKPRNLTNLSKSISKSMAEIKATCDSMVDSRMGYFVEKGTAFCIVVPIEKRKV